MRINSPRRDLTNQLNQSFQNQHVNTTQTRIELLDAAKERIKHITADFSIYAENLGVGLANLKRQEKTEKESDNRFPSERLRMLEEHLQDLSQEREYLSEHLNTLNIINEYLNKKRLLTKEIASSLEIANEEHKKANYKVDELVTIYEEKRQLLASYQNQSKTPLHYSFNTLPSMHANLKTDNSCYLGIETSSEKLETSEADKKTSSVAKNVFSNLGVQFARINPNLSDDA
ncbi:MAG: hypothetical protein Q8L98_04905 [Chlamydiales bacterium]|nr:hypothetical protein [Chlamydiales bacterium]